MIFRLFYSTLVFLTLLSLPIYGQTVTYIERIGGGDLQTVTSPALKHMDSEYGRMQTLPGWSGDMDNYVVRNVVSLGLNREALMGTSTFTGTVAGNINYYDELGVLHTLPFSLTVDFDPAGGTTHKDQSSVVFSGGHAVSIDLTSVSGTTSAMYLESKIEVDRYYRLDYTQSPPGLTHKIGSDFIEFRWGYLEGAVEYELEWVYINDYDLAASTYLPTNELFYNFKVNSTRISTRETSYRISNVFDRGYVVYRVRAVGRRGANYTQRVEGDWTGNGSGSVDQAPNVFDISAHEAAINWSYQVGYTENGRQFEGISYMDGLGYTRQSQVRNNTEDDVIVHEQYYDHQGRVGVSTLPSPSGSASLDYKVDYNQNGTGDHYSKLDFDIDASPISCHTPTREMSNVSGSGQYYSDNNPNLEGQQAYVPNAGGYPFARVEYMPDNTGRVRSLGKAGATHQIGSGHEILYEYGTPSQLQLTRLFGTDVGIYEHYQRNITTDANGQKVVSYIDPYGRLIATALLADTPRGLEAIEGNVEEGTEVTETWLTGTTEQDGSEYGMIQYNKTFIVAVPSDYEFTYSITPEQFTDEECLPEICYDCLYDLTVSITEVNCQDVIFTYTGQVNGSTLDATCSTAVELVLNQANAAGFTQFLTAGTYTLSKKLSVNQASIDYYLAHYLANNDCLLTYENFYDALLTTVDLSGCDASYCDLVCIQEHGTLATYLANNPASNATVYNGLIADCLEACEATQANPCEQLKSQLAK